MNRQANRWCVSVVLSLGALVGGTRGYAQTESPDPRTQALQLLRDAEQLASAGNSAEACLKYRDSASLDAQLDALLPWARCLEKDGKLASAYAAFGDAAEVARRTGDPRLASAEQAVTTLRLRVSFLTINVPVERRAAGLSVELDGFRIGSSSWGVPLPVDPGRHAVVVRAFAVHDWQTTVDVQGEGAQPVIEMPVLEPLAVPVPKPSPGPGAVPLAELPIAPLPPGTGVTQLYIPTRSPASAPPTPVRSVWTTPRIIAVSAAGVSLVAAGFGLYFLDQRNSALDERDGICPTSKNCEPGTNAHLAELTSQARSHQRGEVTSFALAGAGAALALGLWFWPQSQPSDRPAFVAPVLGPSTAGLVLGGRL